MSYGEAGFTPPRLESEARSDPIEQRAVADSLLQGFYEVSMLSWSVLLRAHTERVLGRVSASPPRAFKLLRRATGPQDASRGIATGQTSPFQDLQGCRLRCLVVSALVVAAMQAFLRKKHGNLIRGWRQALSQTDSMVPPRDLSDSFAARLAFSCLPGLAVRSFPSCIS